MNASLQAALKEAYAVAPVTSVTLHTLEFRQQGVQPSIYIVKDFQQMIAYDENGVAQTFLPCGFDFALPGENEDGFRTLNITVVNVQRIAEPFLRAAQSERVPVEVIYRPYLSNDLSTPQMIPPLILYLKDVSKQPDQIVGRATFMDLVNKKYPLELYTNTRFPTL